MTPVTLVMKRPGARGLACRIDRRATLAGLESRRSGRPATSDNASYVVFGGRFLPSFTHSPQMALAGYGGDRAATTQPCALG